MLLSHSHREVPIDSSLFRGEALARQRRRNLPAGSAILGRFEPAANLVEQSVGPNSMNYRLWTVSGYDEEYNGDHSDDHNADSYEHVFAMLSL